MNRAGLGVLLALVGLRDQQDLEPPGVPAVLECLEAPVCLADLEAPALQRIQMVFLG